MNTIRNSETKEQTAGDHESNSVNRFPHVTREIFAILFWVYAISKLFIFDVDRALINLISPNLIWLVHYRFFVFLCILAVMTIVMKSIYVWTGMAYIFLYPGILLFWKIPKLLFKKTSWNFVLALVDSFISLFSSFKQTFILSALYIISAMAILASVNSVILSASLVAVFGIHIWFYYKKVVLVFKPSGVYQVYKSAFSFFHNFVRFDANSTVKQMVLSDKEISTPIESMDEKQLEKWKTGVQWLATFNRICLFISKKMKAYQDSQYNIISFIFGIFFLLVNTVLSFALINYGLSKIAPNSFLVQAEPTFFGFLYYSFNNFFFNHILEILPKTPLAQAISMMEFVFALFLSGIFITLVLSFRSRRETEDLSKVIRYLEVKGVEAEKYLRDKYSLNSIDEALQELERFNSVFADWLYKISASILH